MKIVPSKLWVGAIIPNWLLEQPSVTANSKLVYAALSINSTKYGVVFIKQEEIASQVGMGLRTVQRAINDLETIGLIEKNQVGLNQPNEYRFNYSPWMEGVEHEEQREEPKVPAVKKETADGNKKGSRVSPDWRPNQDTAAWAVKLVGEEGVEWQREKFIDYWISKPGQRGIKLCWNRTFKNWIRNNIEWDKNRSASASSTTNGSGFKRGSQAREERQGGLRSALARKMEELE